GNQLALESPRDAHQGREGLPVLSASDRRQLRRNAPAELVECISLHHKRPWPFPSIPASRRQYPHDERGWQRKTVEQGQWVKGKGENDEIASLRDFPSPL